MRMSFCLGVATWVAAGLISVSGVEAASTLDTIIQSKKLRCGVMLDSPPAGFRDTKNQPDGYDVAYCKDMAKALGVEPVVVETPSPDRIPALVSNRIDVLIASTTPTSARALTVAFTQPYTNNTTVVVTRKDSGIASYADLKSKKLGGVIGSTPRGPGAWVATSSSGRVLVSRTVDSGMVGMGFSFVLDCKMPAWYPGWSVISRRGTCTLSRSVVTTGLLILILLLRETCLKMHCKRYIVFITSMSLATW